MDLKSKTEILERLHWARCGYDALGRLGHKDSSRHELFTAEGLARTATVQSMPEESTVIASGSSTTELVEELKVSAELSGSYGMFKGEARAMAQMRLVRKRTERFYYKRYLAPSWLVKLPIGVEALRDALTPYARGRIEGGSAAAVLEEFGTHIPIGMYFGAMLEVRCASASSSEESDQRFEAEAKASYKSFSGEISGNASSEGKANRQLEEESMRFRSERQGDQEAPVLIGFQPRTQLKPIWQLARAVERKEEIKRAYAKLKEDRRMVLTDIRVVNRDELPRDFERVPVDLNEGTQRGRTLPENTRYLAVRYLSVEEARKNGIAPVTGLAIHDANDAGHYPVPRGYQKRPANLNPAGDGHRLYLCVRTQEGAYTEAIEEVTVVSAQSTDNAVAPVGFDRVDPNLNRMAGGRFLYLAVR